MKIVRHLLDRVYADFLMPSRLSHYAAFLRRALEEGYEVRSVERLWTQARDGTLPPKVLVLRHDVDTAPKVTREMWDIETSLQLHSSTRYFRLKTVDVELMHEMARKGVEVGYHFEEVATFAKRHRLRSKDAVLARMPEIRAEFSENLLALRRRTGLPLTTCASHGDFVNRALSLSNRELLLDDDLRKTLQVSFEAYDGLFEDLVGARFSDRPHPVYWQPGNPLVAVEAGIPRIYVVLHPRQWKVSPLAIIKENAVRSWEGLRFGA